MLSQPLDEQVAGAPVRQQRILVAIDESKPAGWAVQLAGRWAQALSARVMLLHVVQPSLGLGMDYMAAVRLDESRKVQGAALLESVQRTLPSSLHAERQLRE